MMKLDDIIKSEFYTLSTLGGQMLFDKAIKEIEYLKSLKPVFPKFVSEWINGKSSSEAYFKLIDAYYNPEELSDDIKKVLIWFEYDPASGRFYKRMGSRYVEWVEITGKDDD